MSSQLLMLYLVAAILVTLAPGPDILTVIARSISQGSIAGLVAAFGFASGLVLHTTAAALGLSLLLKGSPAAFRVIQILGAAYLIWLAIRMSIGTDPLIVEDQAHESLALWRIYRQSILMNVLNPQVMIFFVAFLSRFLDKQGSFPVWLQFLILGGLFAVCTVTCFSICALLAGKLTGFVRRRPHATRPLRIAVALVFALVAVSIVLA